MLLRLKNRKLASKMHQLAEGFCQTYTKGEIRMSKEEAGAGARSVVLRQIGWVSGISIVVGSIFGTGIFVAPAISASASSSYLFIAGLWILGACLCYLGADLYGRLGRIFPEGGGQYVYLKKCLGEPYSVLYGWLSFLIICPTMLAGLALFFSSQVKIYYPELSPVHLKLIAIGFIAMLTVVNCRGIEAAGLLQKVVVVLQLGLVLIPIAVVWCWVGAPSTDGSAGVIGDVPQFSLTKALFAFVAILWSFEGFNTLTFVTDEVKNGYRTIRRLTLAGCWVVFVIYFMVNLTAFRFLTLGELRQTKNVAVSLSELGLGSAGAVVVLLLTMVAILSTVHAALLIGPRITRVLAADGYILKFLKEVHPLYTSPNNALWFQLGLVVLYILSGTFENLISWFIVINWIFYSLVMVGLMRISKQPCCVDGQVMIQNPTLERLKCLVFIIFVFVFILGNVIDNPIPSVVGFLVFVLGLVVSSAVVKARRKNANVFSVSP